ncbi:STYKc [Seminavis robusta]|uniref:STYKc n=1 Tax=Seminavis robusta TaxID=568900 RepID=A0A9N8HPS5_9STRA|nr:STYKc [Seminavis robusta]|eukprot:Sro1099_g241070.1 STYKc (678) ;mRNA; f:6257-8446
MSWVGVTLKDTIGNLGKNTDTTETTDMDSNLHDVELERGDSLNRAVSIGEVGAPARFRHIKNNKYMRRLYLVLAALAAIFVLSSLLRLAVKGKKNGDGSSGAVENSGVDFDLSGASLRLAHLYVFMHDNSNDALDRASLRNASSPQRKALQWIADEDPMKLGVPETRFDASYPAFVQRYSVAVLAFATDTKALEPLGFLSGASECQWNADFRRPDGSILKMGIICNGEQNQVQKVVLQTLGLSGTIPREIGHLHSVKHLHLDQNDLTGMLPQSMRHMSQLREFTATRNSLSGHLPSFLGQMASLRHIELSKNHFSGHLSAFATKANDESVDDLVSPLRVLAVDNNRLSGPLEYIRSLYVLEELYLDDNALTGHLSDSLTDLSQLAIFTAAKNKLSGKVPDYLLQLPSMAVLDLHANSFSQGFPHGNATTLKYLDLHANNIEGVLPRSIGSKPELVYLDVSQNAFTGGLPDEIGRLRSLQYLFLSDNPGLKPAAIPKFIWELPVLESLSLRNTARTGMLPDWLVELDQLRLLDLEHNDLNGTLPETMFNMSSLEYLFLNRNRFGGTIPETWGNLTEIELLNLDHNELSGQMPDSVCALDMEVLVTDCGTSDAQPEPAIECACCTKCCLASASNCNARDWSKRFGNDWGGKFYERYNIVEDGDVFEIVDRKNDGDHGNN